MDPDQLHHGRKISGRVLLQNTEPECPDQSGSMPGTQPDLGSNLPCHFTGQPFPQDFNPMIIIRRMPSGILLTLTAIRAVVAHPKGNNETFFRG